MSAHDSLRFYEAHALSEGSLHSFDSAAFAASWELAPFGARFDRDPLVSDNRESNGRAPTSERRERVRRTQ
jgi:hypothetical protein